MIELSDKYVEDKHLFEVDVESVDSSPISPDDKMMIHYPSPIPRRVIGRVLALRLAIRNALLFLLPSFTTRLLTGKGTSETLRPTAYLDGLRGVAAWAVFNAHLSATLIKHAGAALSHPGHHTQLYKWPIVRLIYTGEFAVAIFFIISGFALSISPVLAMRKTHKDPAVAMRKLASAIFRRPIRLFFPSIMSMLVVFVLIRLGYFTSIQERLPEIQKVVDGWPVIDHHWPMRHDTLLGQSWDLLRSINHLFWIFSRAGDEFFRHHYNGVLWTIQLEFRASIVLYLTHACVFFLRKPIRVALVSGLIVLALTTQCWDLPLFWVGYLLAEFSSLTSNEAPTSRLGSIISWCVLTVGAFLGSYPAWNSRNATLWAWMVPINPFRFALIDRWWAAVAAVMVLWSIRRIPILVRLYSSRPIQYLGKLSFSFYLVHFWIVEGFGLVLFYKIWSFTGTENSILAFIGFVFGYAILLGVVIWIADVFWRSVDVYGVKIGAKLENLCFESAERSIILS